MTDVFRSGAPGCLRRVLPWAVLLLVAAGVSALLHLGRHSAPPADTESGGCPPYTRTGPWPSAKPMNPGIPEHDPGTPRSVRLVIPADSYTRLGFDEPPQIAFPDDPEGDGTWEADPADTSELTVCAYVTRKGPADQGCSYYWVPTPGTPTPADSPPAADLFRSRVLFRVYDTRTGVLRGTFTLPGENANCPREWGAAAVPEAPDDAAIRARVAPYR